VYTLTQDTSYISAGLVSFGSYVDTDVGVHTPGSVNHYETETEEAYRNVVLFFIAVWKYRI
jgi:hypothetical protein